MRSLNVNFRLIKGYRNHMMIADFNLIYLLNSHYYIKSIYKTNINKIIFFCQKQVKNNKHKKQQIKNYEK